MEENPDDMLYTIDPKQGYVVDKSFGHDIHTELMTKIKADIERQVES